MILVAKNSNTAPSKCNMPMMRCAAKNLSAIIPTKKGEIMVAMASAPYAEATCTPLDCKCVTIYVPMVTYQAPQMKYWRNIIMESRINLFAFMKLN